MERAVETVPDNNDPACDGKKDAPGRQAEKQRYCGPDARQGYVRSVVFGPPDWRAPAPVTGEHPDNQRNHPDHQFRENSAHWRTFLSNSEWIQVLAMIKPQRNEMPSHVATSTSTIPRL
jgi:hypothetical protein